MGGNLCGWQMSRKEEMVPSGSFFVCQFWEVVAHLLQ